MANETQRWMKNTKTGVVFHYDALQVMDDRRPWMVECSKEGVPLVDERQARGPDALMRLTRENAELRATLNERAAKSFDTDALAAENNRLKGRVAELEAEVAAMLAEDAKLSEKVPAPVETATESGESLASLREKARELGLKGVFRKSKAELDEMIAAAQPAP